MDVIYLEPGKRAPADCDCVLINQLPSGKAGFTGSVLVGRAESLFATSENSYDTSSEAQAAAVAWAHAHGVATLYVELPDA